MAVFDRTGSPTAKATQKWEDSGQVCTSSRHLPRNLPSPLQTGR